MAKKVSNNSIDKIIKNVVKSSEEIEIGYGEERVSFVVSWDTDITRRMQSITDGISLAYNEDGEFIPAIASLSYAYALLSCFTNFKTEKIEKIYTLTQLTDVIEKIEGTLPSHVLKYFKVDYNECFNAYKERLNRLNNVDELCDSLTQLVSTFGGVGENFTSDTIDTALKNAEPQLSLVNKEE